MGGGGGFHGGGFSGGYGGGLHGGDNGGFHGGYNGFSAESHGEGDTYGGHGDGHHHGDHRFFGGGYAYSDGWYGDSCDQLQYRYDQYGRYIGQQWVNTCY
jgi:hypothetical protein